MGGSLMTPCQAYPLGRIYDSSHTGSYRDVHDDGRSYPDLEKHELMSGESLLPLTSNA
jgi:hypothetical protein